MEETTTPTTALQLTLPSLRSRTNFVIAATLFHWGTIAVLGVFGDDKNSLHTSLLAWTFGSYIVIFVAFVFGVMLDVKNYFASSKV